ncbi:hypothetical protein EC968_007481 [Mortierella alpina]|nr:hypothetical protein EC968_007481 [Mortierella alpina]
MRKPLQQQGQHMLLDQTDAIQPQPALQQLQQLPEHKDEGKNLAIPTDITIKTDVDPHGETTTTTTIVHLPFEIAQQCPPPKVISWMKSHRAARPKHAAQHNNAHYHHHHHHSSRHSSPSRVERLLPFLRKRRSSVEHAKKGNSAVTVFSIQVTVLGRVLVPPSGTELASTLGQEQPGTLKPEDLAPTKTIPAQISRSETTSYVIHRTFEDFQRLSEGVLCLQRALLAHHLSHQQQQRYDDQRHHEDHTLRHQQEPSTASSTESGTVSDPVASSTFAPTTAASVQPREGPVLTALRVRHPRPNLYQSFLRQFGFSTAKANQRAFDASSTTHGFHEEGAFERVLELNQYLEDVWYWLLPENIPPGLDLSLVHDIMQWLKPSSQGTHADGRQMRDRQDQSPPQPKPETSIMRRNQGQPKTVTMEPRSSVSTVAVGHGDVVQDEGLDARRSSSATSLPSLSSTYASSSSATSATSPNSSMSEASVAGPSNDETDANGSAACEGILHETPFEAAARAKSPSANTTFHNVDMKSVRNAHLPTPKASSETPRPTTEPLPSLSKRRRRQGTATDPTTAATKAKRRISFSHVLKSLSFSNTSDTHPRSRPPHARQSFHESAAGHNSKNVSASMPTSPTLKDTFGGDDIYIWSTVTTKNMVGARPTVISSPAISASSST